MYLRVTHGAVCHPSLRSATFPAGRFTVAFSCGRARDILWAFHHPCVKPHAQDALERFMASSSSRLEASVADAVRLLWRDASIQKAYAQRHELGLKVGDRCPQYVRKHVIVMRAAAACVLACELCRRGGAAQLLRKSGADLVAGLQSHEGGHCVAA